MHTSIHPFFRSLAARASPISRFDAAARDDGKIPYSHYVAFALLQALSRVVHGPASKRFRTVPALARAIVTSRGLAASA
ncbi:MAG: hypothetical protein ABI411_20090 [Tahibacter sp.]